MIILYQLFSILLLYMLSSFEIAQNYSIASFRCARSIFLHWWYSVYIIYIYIHTIKYAFQLPTLSQGISRIYCNSWLPSRQVYIQFWLVSIELFNPICCTQDAFKTEIDIFFVPFLANSACGWYSPYFLYFHYYVVNLLLIMLFYLWVYKSFLHTFFVYL